jgi:hypothetical protein
VAGILTRSPSGIALGALKLWRRREAADPAEADSERGLVVALDKTAEIADRLTQQLRTTPAPSQPVANAASICRWELMVLRERIRMQPINRRMEAIQVKVLRHLDGAGAAAATLSRGYRFHDLDSICRGGEALDEHIDALAKIRGRLVGS